MKISNDFDEIYMGFARGISVKSKAQRKKVGACIVTTQGVTLLGYNGTPSGWDNTCEDEDFNTTKEVIHAELNCVLKAAREGVSIVGSTCYVTLSPCVSCAAMLAQAGVKRVVYEEEYRDTKGITLLKQNGVEVVQLNSEEESFKGRRTLWLYDSNEKCKSTYEDTVQILRRSLANLEYIKETARDFKVQFKFKNEDVADEITFGCITCKNDLYKYLGLQIHELYFDDFSSFSEDVIEKLQSRVREFT